VKDGECAAIWNRQGVCTKVTGPALKYIWFSDVRFLDRVVADQSQYLVVKFRDGRKEHLRGPISFFVDPTMHEMVTVEDSISLVDHEAIIVYREEEGLQASATVSDSKQVVGIPVSSVPSTSVQRRVIKGPTCFIPTANEWVHQFSWHGSVSTNKTEKSPNALKFFKLRTLPSQLYYNVRDVRTSDDAQLCVKLMIFYHLENLEKMLTNTHDPIGDFINAGCADVIKFAAGNTFENFLHRTSELNELANFQILVKRAADIGYCVDKVVFRGYKASEHLQAMHDTAIKARTKLRLESENVEQQMSIEAIKLKSSYERSEQEREMAIAKQQHTLDLEQKKAEIQLSMDKTQHEFKLQKQQQQHDIKMKQLQNENSETIKYLEKLANAGVDLTQYLIAQQQRQPDRILRIEGGGASSDAFPQPNIHISDK